MHVFSRFLYFFFQMAGGSWLTGRAGGQGARGEVQARHRGAAAAD